MRRRLGEVLLDRKHISAEALRSAVEEQQTRLGLLGELLLARGVNKTAVVEALTETMRIPYVDAATVTPDPAALMVIPPEAAARYQVLPLGFEGHVLVVIMAEPQNLHLIDELQFLTSRRLSPRLGFRAEIQEAIARHYPESSPPSLFPLDAGAEREAEFLTVNASVRAQEAVRAFQAELRHERTPAVRLVSALLTLAAKRRASDIHVEPLTEEMIVRFRVDGVLHEVLRVPPELRLQLISRLKIVADMDIAEHRAPQDGRFLVRLEGKQFDVRASAMPTQYGEKIVLRLLDSSAAGRTFEDLGYSKDNVTLLTQVLRQPQGMLLVTGPTGSGKTTTLYAALTLLRSPKVNIVTIEDPVEYVLDGVNQVQVSPKSGRTFADCLRSMLRQDPNVILVGEIRDAETADIALQAAQTGHLVLSTMHTNDAVSAVTRLVDLGIPAFSIASSLTAVIAQRLVRMLCHCRNEEVLSPEREAELPTAILAHVRGCRLYTPTGCPECDQSGYRGRIGVCEVLCLNDEVRAAIRAGLRDGDIRDLARTQGMRLMQEDALLKIEQGITSVEEAVRVVPFEPDRQRRCRECRRLLSQSFVYCPFCGVAAPAEVPAWGAQHRSANA